MIRPLRVRHRVITLVMAVALPTGFGLSLAFRPPPIEAFSDSADGDSRDAAASAVPMNGLPLRGRILRGAQEPRLLLVPEDELTAPDLLVYLTHGEGPFDGLPDDAHLLGVLAGAAPRGFALPPGIRMESASILLYSLAHHELLGGARLPRDE